MAVNLRLIREDHLDYGTVVSSCSFRCMNDTNRADQSVLDAGSILAVMDYLETERQAGQ
jgi:hypothetical protein